MKKIAICILAVSFIAAFNAVGQEKYKNDPTYSINNYKHPNKAKIANENKKDEFFAIDYVESKNDNSRNYKQQNISPSVKPQGMVLPVIGKAESKNALVNPSNYKTHQ